VSGQSIDSAYLSPREGTVSPVESWPDEMGGRVWTESPRLSEVTTKPEGTDGYDGVTISVSKQGGIVTLAGDDGERRTLTILNTTPGTTILVGRRGQLTNGGGFLLPSGVLLPMTTYREVFAWVPPSADNTERIVSVMTERNKT